MVTPHDEVQGYQGRFSKPPSEVEEEDPSLDQALSDLANAKASRIRTRCVMGGRGKGSLAFQLNCPEGIALLKDESVNESEHFLVSCRGSHRIVRFSDEGKEDHAAHGVSLHQREVKNLTTTSPAGVVSFQLKETNWTAISDTDGDRVVLLEYHLGMKKSPRTHFLQHLKKPAGLAWSSLQSRLFVAVNHAVRSYRIEYECNECSHHQPTSSTSSKDTSSKETRATRTTRERGQKMLTRSQSKALIVVEEPEEATTRKNDDVFIGNLRTEIGEYHRFGDEREKLNASKSGCGGATNDNDSDSSTDSLLAGFKRKKRGGSGSGAASSSSSSSKQKLSSLQKLSFPSGLALDDRRGILYVADTFNDRILRVRLRRSGGDGSEDGGNIHNNEENENETSVSVGQGVNLDQLQNRTLLTPRGIACAGSYLFVADTGNHRVLQIQLYPTKIQQNQSQTEEEHWQLKKQTIREFQNFSLLRRIRTTTKCTQ